MSNTDSVLNFRALHAGERVLALANCWDAASAALAVAAGSRAVATSSAGLAWACGFPDGGALPRADLLHVVRAVMRIAADVPVSVDLEDGFSGDAREVADLVLTLRELDVAGINIEDGTGSPDLLVEKIAAIKRTLRERGDDIFINARTDVLLRDLASGETAVRESIARAQRYLSAGADGIFVPMLRDPNEIRTVASAVATPLNILAVAGLPSLTELYALGVRRLSAGSGISKVAYGAAFSAARAFVHDDQRDRLVFLPTNADYSEMNALLAAHP